MTRPKFTYIVLVSSVIISWICIIIFSMLPSKDQKLIEFVPVKHSSPLVSPPATTYSYMAATGGGGGHVDLSAQNWGGRGGCGGRVIPEIAIIPSHNHRDHLRRVYPIK